MITNEEIIDYLASHDIMTNDDALTLLNKKRQITINKDNKTTTFYRKQVSQHIYFAHERGMQTTTEQRYKYEISFDDLLYDGDKTSSDNNVDEFVSFYFLSSICTLIPCRHYFDIDHLEHPLTLDQIRNIMHDFYEPTFLDIVHIGVSSCMKRTDDRIEYGYHIVVPGICSSLQSLEAYVKNYNAKTTTQIRFDDKVYNGGRLFRLPYSTDSIKPNPYMIISGTFDDWDLANTTDSLMVDLNEYIEQIPLLYKINEVVKKKEYEHEIVSKTLFYNRMNDKYNFDLVPANIKLTLFKRFVEATISKRKNTTTSKYTEFYIHNDRNTNVNDNNCPAENKEDLVISKYMFVQQLYFTIARSVYIEYGSGYGPKRLNSIIEPIFKQTCELFDQCLTIKARSTGSLFAKSQTINYNQVYDDRKLYKLINIFEPELFKEFLLEQKLDMNYDNNSTHPFFITQYTYGDYIINMTKYETLQQHMMALSKCIAYSKPLSKFIIKMDDPTHNRVRYEIQDETAFANKRSCKVSIREYVNTHYEDRTINDVDDECISNSSSSQTNILKSANKPKIVYRDKTLLDIIFMMLRSNIMLIVSKPQYFVDITYDIKDDDTFILLDNNASMTNEATTNDNIANTPFVRKRSYRLTPDVNYDNYAKLALFIPPSPLKEKYGGYDKVLIQDWIGFMKSRIKLEFHNAFIDLLYSIRYRLTTSNATPTKAYILHGTGGCEGKSFLLGCLSKLFGEQRINLDKNQFLNDQFNGWKTGKGLIVVEECEGNTRTQTQLATAIKNYTTVDSGTRNMHSVNVCDINYGVLTFSTNDATLNGLINADAPTINRLVIIAFKPFVEDKSLWQIYVNEFINNSHFAYSLWRYLISSEGFVANEGKDYRYTSERYEGAEKSEFIRQARNKNKSLADLFVSMLRYEKDKYNQLATWVIKEEENMTESIKNGLIDGSAGTKRYKILKYSENDLRTYVGIKALQTYKNMFCLDIHKENDKLDIDDIEDAMIRNGWAFESPISLTNRDRVIGYVKSIDKTDMLYDNYKGANLRFNEEEDENSDEDIKNEHDMLISMIEEHIKTNLISESSKYKYITVKSINNLLKENKNKLVKNDIDDILFKLKFDLSPSVVTINKTSVYVYKQKK